MKTFSVAVCALEVNGKYPLIRFKRNYLTGYWGIPGGKFDDTEFLPEAAEREMLEEIKHRVKFKSFLAVVDEFAVRPEETFRVLLYICRVEAAEPINQEPYELPEGRIEWFTPEQITGLKDEMTPSDYRIFHEIVLGQGRGYYKSQLNTTGDKLTLDLFEQITSESDRVPTVS